MIHWRAKKFLWGCASRTCLKSALWNLLKIILPVLLGKLFLEMSLTECSPLENTQAGCPPGEVGGCCWLLEPEAGRSHACVGGRPWGSSRPSNARELGCKSPFLLQWFSTILYCRALVPIKRKLFKGFIPFPQSRQKRWTWDWEIVKSWGVVDNANFVT